MTYLNVKLTIRIPQHIKDKLDVKSSERSMSKNHIINDALRDYFSGNSNATNATNATNAGLKPTKKSPLLSAILKDGKQSL